MPIEKPPEAESAKAGGSDETEIEVTPEMIGAGAEAILREVGGADLGGFFSARDLAAQVYLAMRRAELESE